MRFIDITGKELLKIEKGQYGAYLASDEDLQFVGKEYYFIMTYLLDIGEIFVSPFETYITPGGEYSIQDIRFGIPIFDNAGNKKGIIILTLDKDLFMNTLLKSLGPNNYSFYVLCVISDSIFNIEKLKEIGLVLDNTTSDLFAQKFPGLTTFFKNLSTINGQFYNSYGLFTYDTFYNRSEAGASDIKWFVISLIPKNKLNKINLHIIFKRFISRQIFIIILIFFSSIVISFLLITRREMANNLKVSEDNLTKLIEAIPALIAFLNINGKWLISNKANLYVFGLNDIKYSGLDKDELKPYIKCDIKVFDEFFDIADVVSLEKTVEKEIMFNTSSREDRIFDVKKIPLFEKNGKIRGIIIACWDITDRKKYEEELKLYATTDAMTGVLNRRKGLELLDQQIKFAKRKPFKFTICYIDINNLKYVNDNYGHNDGDFMILKVVDTIKANLRESDVVCRLGGDEFMILFIDCTEEQARNNIERIVRVMDDYNKKGEKPYKITISKGFAEFSPGEEMNAEELIALADIEMYRDKQQTKKLL
jgi:diguanylate cyclase (GGDEF)-like protein/PAS domain S-box-containing protein